MRARSGGSGASAAGAATARAASEQAATEETAKDGAVTEGVAREEAAKEEAATGSNGRSAALHLWVVLARSAAAVGRHSERDIVRHGLTPGEFMVLEALFHKGPLLLGEVQRKILASSGGVTYMVDRVGG